MKQLFLSLISLLIIFIAACDSPNTGEANNENDTADTEVAVDRTTDQIHGETNIEATDLIYFTFMNNQMQTVLGEVAEQKAASENVQRFGSDVVGENKQIAAKIEDLARAADIPRPGGLGVDQQQKVDSIQNLPPQEFDKAFIKLMLEQQERNVELLTELAQEGDNPIIRGLAADISESERDQIERAKIIKDEMM